MPGMDHELFEEEHPLRALPANHSPHGVPAAFERTAARPGCVRRKGNSVAKQQPSPVEHLQSTVHLCVGVRGQRRAGRLRVHRHTDPVREAVYRGARQQVRRSVPPSRRHPHPKSVRSKRNRRTRPPAGGTRMRARRSRGNIQDGHDERARACSRKGKRNRRAGYGKPAAGRPTHGRPAAGLSRPSARDSTARYGYPLNKSTEKIKILTFIIIVHIVQSGGRFWQRALCATRDSEPV